MNKYMTLILYFKTELKVISTSIFYKCYWGYLICVLCVKTLQSYPTLWTPWTAACQASLSMGILQARILERVVMPSSRGSSWPRDQTHVSYVSCIGRWVLYHWHHLGSPLLNILMVKCFLINFLGNVSWIQWALFSFFYLLKISRRP